jgi:carboxyl-terminal processing protease
MRKSFSSCFRTFVLLNLLTAPCAWSAEAITPPPEDPEGATVGTDGAAVTQDSGEGGLPLNDLRKFVEVFDRIKKAYVEDVDDSTLLNNAIRGMLTGLDPHSAYLEPQAFDELQESTSGEFGGLGIEVGMEDGFIRVIAPIDDTPAQKAGLEPGDLIIKLDTSSVKGMTLDEAVNAMRGPPGTTIMLTIIRSGEDGPIEVPVVRDVIRVVSVKQQTLEEGFGYVRITQFQAQTGIDFEKALKKLSDNKPGGLKGVVLDLRNNPGGVLQAAVEVADSLLDEGMIVYTEGRIKSSKLRFTATPGDVLGGAPVVVLVNGGSASASEIVAGALQDHKRALIMGEDSFGKGSVQTVLPLDHEYGLKLTTARYFTPNGRSIQALGIVPDIEVKRARLMELSGQPVFKESDLSGHLSNGSEPGSSVQDKSADQTKLDPGKEMVEKDYQLREAFNLLKGLSIMKTTQLQQSVVSKP